MERVAQVTRHTRRVVGQHDVERSWGRRGRGQERLDTGTTVKACTGDARILVDMLIDDRPPLLFRVASGDGDLIVDGRGALQVAGIPGVDGYSPATD